MSFRVRPASRFGGLLEHAAGRKGASVLAMSAALALVAPTASPQSVGVTSATVGDPLGKPPLEVERVLHVGVDVKANELITTGVADRAHLVFLDGTALSVGPEARLVIDSFVYDADHKLGELSFSATRGVFRFVGGNISKKKAVTITTPSSAITIRGGIMMLAVDPAETRATFLYGQAMTVTGHGKSQVVTQAWMGCPDGRRQCARAAMQIAPGALAGQMAMLEGPGRPVHWPGGRRAPAAGKCSGARPAGRDGAQTARRLRRRPASNNRPVDEAISRSGLPDINSGRGLHATGGSAPGQPRRRSSEGWPSAA